MGLKVLWFLLLASQLWWCLLNKLYISCALSDVGRADTTGWCAEMPKWSWWWTYTREGCEQGSVGNLHGLPIPMPLGPGKGTGAEWLYPYPYPGGTRTANPCGLPIPVPMPIWYILNSIPLVYISLVTVEYARNFAVVVFGVLLLIVSRTGILISFLACCLQVLRTQVSIIILPFAPFIRESWIQESGVRRSLLRNQLMYVLMETVKLFIPMGQMPECMHCACGCDPRVNMRCMTKSAKGNGSELQKYKVSSWTSGS